MNPRQVDEKTSRRDTYTFKGQATGKVVSAQRHRAGHVSLVSRGSQPRGFVEAGTVGLMTWGGGEEHVKSDTAVPSWESASRCPEEAPRKPRGSPKHEDPEI
ncbi:E3 ubiquitin-protein ligase TTC3 [Dissostichus eleginoides]|uniref:E3 ubiquitin-protein ligase TTC3 n=1 Tax=Dissostichus eleginoides TaxID=100907 RepID=A0AAD9BYW9_DISEL|nr:E3 ubiquitin-protein ligase TTC3 [Dissostichus eleginoides]